jgi:hypothetical protein
VLDSDVTVEEDLFSLTVSDAGENQAALPGAAFASNRVTSLGQWARNQFGQYGFKKAVTIPKNATQAELKTEDNALGTKFDSAEWNRATLPVSAEILNEGTSSAELRTAEAKRNKFGLFDAVMARILPKEKVYTYEFQVGTHYFWYSFFRNITQAKLTTLLGAANAKAGTLIDSSVTPSLSHNAFGLIDGYVSVLYRTATDSRTEDSGYSIFSLHGTVEGPWIYSKIRNEGTGLMESFRLRNTYQTYHQQGPDYAHGLQDFYSAMGAPPNVELGSKITRLGKNWYEFHKIYGPPIASQWEQVV